MKIGRLSKEEVEAAIAPARSYAEALRTLRLIVSGGSYLGLKAHVARLGISTEHFTGQGWLKNGVGARKKPAEVFRKRALSESPRENGAVVKRCLAEIGRPEICEICGLEPFWQGARLVLALDHIDGDSRNNEIENLRLLCPNCHSQTPTYTGRNKKRYKP